MNWYKIIKIAISKEQIKSKEKQSLKILDNNQSLFDQIKNEMNNNSLDIIYLPIISFFHKKEGYPISLLIQDMKDHKRFSKNPQISSLEARNDGIYLNNKKLSNYLELQSKIHSLKAREENKNIKQNTESESNLSPIAIGDNILVYEGKNLYSCIEAGRGSSFCISSPNISRNMYETYRDRHESAFYFIRDNNKNANDPMSLVLVDVRPDGILITDKNNIEGKISNLSYNQYFEYLNSKGISKDIFVKRPLSEEEKKENEMFKNKIESLDEFANLTFEYKRKYISKMYILSFEQLKYLINSGNKELIELYLSLGHQLSDEQINFIINNKNYLSKYIRSRERSQSVSNANLTGLEFKLISEEQKKKYHNILLEAIRYGYETIEEIPKNILDNEICLEAVKYDGNSLLYVPEDMKTKEICESAVKNLPFALHYVPKELITHELCLTAVKKEGRSLEFVPFEYRDREIVFAAIKKDGEAIKYAPRQMVNKELCEEAVKSNIYSVLEIPVNLLLEHQELSITVVKKNGYNLRLIPREVCLKYPNISREAVENNPYAIKFVFPEIEISNPEICEKALFSHEIIKEDLILNITPEVFERNRDLCFKIIEKNPSLILYIPNSAKLKYPEICLEAIKRNDRLISYIPEQLMLDNEELSSYILELIKEDPKLANNAGYAFYEKYKSVLDKILSNYFERKK